MIDAEQVIIFVFLDHNFSNNVDDKMYWSRIKKCLDDKLFSIQILNETRYLLVTITMRSQIKSFDNIFTFQRHICHEMTSKEVDKCCACKFPIKNNLHIALGLKWHRNCFRCSECLCTDPSHYIASDNVLYCKKDYVLKFGEHCQRCKEQITGPVMVAGDQKYHTECFVCTKCLKFIGYDDDYMLVERHNLYCNDCYKRSVLPAISTPVGKLGHCHTIQHINLTPTPVGRRKFSVLIEKANDIHKFLRSANPIIAQNGERRSYIAIDNVDASSELKARGVQSGDKVLEVNNIMVTDATVDKLSHIISNPQRVQTLTIERNNAVKQPFNSDIKISKKKEVLPSAILRSPVDRQSSLDLIGSPDYDQKYKKHLMPWDEDTEDGYVINGQRKTRKKPERANSLPRSNSTDNNNVMKCNSVLHRSQSVRTSVGQVFRPCDLILGEVIGKGFFGQVSKVVHRGTGKVMVLKELVRCDVAAQKQFVKEVTLLKTLDHPNVLKFIGILYKNKVLSFIAEYIAGGTLRGILKDQTRNLSWSQRVKFAKDIALGMDYLHKMNIIHRDLKSKNCLVRKDEGMTIVVADFGLAGILSIDEEENGTVQDQNNNGNKSLTHVQTRHTAPKNVRQWSALPIGWHPKCFTIISRVKASPDFIPRTKTFGLDESSFEEKFCSDCPKAFYRIACLSCDMNPSDRPTFASLSYWLEALLVHLEVGMTLPNDVSSVLLSSKSKKK